MMGFQIEEGDNPGVRRIKMTLDMFMKTIAHKQLGRYDDWGLMLHYQLFCICEAFDTFLSTRTDQALLDLFQELEHAQRSLGDLQK